jgi:hypothetical protein
MTAFKRGDRVRLPSGKLSTIKGIRRLPGDPETLYLCGSASWRGSYTPHGVFTARDLRNAVADAARAGH